MRRLLAASAAVSVVLALGVPASATAEKKPASETSSMVTMSSTEKGSPAATATHMVAFVISTIGLVLTLAALTKGVADILQLTQPPANLLKR